MSKQQAWNKGNKLGKKHTVGCSVPGCDRMFLAKGYCQTHYNQHARGVADEDMCKIHSRRNRGTGGLHEGYIRFRRDGVWTTEHRIVMERMLGRALLPNENVHHINGVRDDNREENLELWVTSQPSGQRPEDLVAWAKSILSLYDKEGGD